MADPILLADINQDDYNTAEATLVSLVRAAYPTLDLRRGTVMRDILIRPAASIYAYNSKQLADLQRKMSIITLASDPNATPEDLDAVLANFGVQRSVGDTATGQLMIRVDGNRVYTLAAGSAFATLEGLRFVTTDNYTARMSPGAGELPLLQTDDGLFYYFILPVEADTIGAEYNITQGTALNPEGSLYGFVAAEAYVNFASGVDEETINQIIARLPAAVSYKALESRTAIDAKLHQQFDNAGLPIQAISVQGYGDPAQLRDKHNPMGFAVGSRVDVYTRTFTAPPISVFQKTATRIAPNTFQFTLSRTEAPGFYKIRAITELDSAVTDVITGAPTTTGSYAFTDVRAASGINGTFHDIDPDNSMIETAYSAYQEATITVTGVPEANGVETAHTFKVEVYVAPGIADIQAFVDSTAVRNVESDYVARSPLICLVSLDVKVYYASTRPVDVAKMRQDIVDYINSRSFIQRLTRSELACILHADGATRIDLGTTGMILQGTVRDAAGVEHTLQGDSLEISQVENPQALFTCQTTVFACEAPSIFIEAVAE
jgi:hypothetical protein